MNKITFVTVVYNNYTDTIDFLNSIEKFAKKEEGIRCIVIDNSDEIKIRDRIAKLSSIYSFVTTLAAPKNLGYFGGFNYFFDNFKIDSSEIILLCNNDLVFSDDFIDAFKSREYPRDVFVVCPDVITLDGVHQNPHVLNPRTSLQRLKLDFYFSHYSIAYTLRLLQRLASLFYKKNKHRFFDPCYLHMGIGACYILLPSFLSKCKNLEYPHFLYGEEAYLTKQVHSAGGKLYYDPVLKVHHKESATLSKLPKRINYEFGREGYWNYRTYF